MSLQWSKGYVSDVTYSHGYYHELSPAFLRFALLFNGLANGAGEPGSRYHYCELGYGQGVSANLHAAANPRGCFWGTDFNPDHAIFARGLAQQAGVDATWLATGFEELLDADLPSFDFITLHGVWSWVDAAARHAIVEFMRRRLKVGGVVYISYNTMPGWSAEKPLRDLMWMHTELAGASGEPTIARIKGALNFANRLRRGKAAYFELNPKAGAMLDDMQRDDMHVVAHEYFNRSWHITYFADLARSLEAAGLGFACSVHKSDLVGEVQQRRDACRMADMHLNVALQETTHDFLLNRRFRRDLFVRGADRLTPADRIARLQEVAVVLLRPAAAVPTELRTPYGEVRLDEALCRKLLAVLDTATDPIRLAQLIEAAQLPQLATEPVFATVAALIAQNCLFPVFPEDAGYAPQARARSMNDAIARRAAVDDTLRYLASPVTGHAIEASQWDRLFWALWEQGARTASELVERMNDSLSSAARQELPAQAARFIDTVVPVWRRLGLLTGQTP